MGGLAYINLKSSCNSKYFPHSHVEHLPVHLKTIIIVTGFPKCDHQLMKSALDSPLVTLYWWILVPGLKPAPAAFLLFWDFCPKKGLKSYALLSTCEVLMFLWAHWLVISSICMVCKSEILDPPILLWSALKFPKGIWTALSPHFLSRSSMERLELQRKIWVKRYLKNQMTNQIQNFRLPQCS